MFSSKKIKGIFDYIDKIDKPGTEHRIHKIVDIVLDQADNKFDRRFTLETLHQLQLLFQYGEQDKKLLSKKSKSRSCVAMPLLEEDLENDISGLDGRLSNFEESLQSTLCKSIKQCIAGVALAHAYRIGIEGVCNANLPLSKNILKVVMRSQAEEYGVASDALSLSIIKPWVIAAKAMTYSDFQKRQTELNRLLDMWPFFTEGHYFQGTVYHNEASCCDRIGQYDLADYYRNQARICYRRSLERRSKNHRANYMLALLSEEVGLLRCASNHLKKAIDNSPRFNRAAIDLARVYSKRYVNDVKMYDECFDAIKLDKSEKKKLLISAQKKVSNLLLTALAKEPDNIAFKLDAAEIFARVKLLEKAKTLYENLLSTDEEFSRFQYDDYVGDLPPRNKAMILVVLSKLAGVFWEMGRLSDATCRYQQIIMIDPLDYTARVRLGDRSFQLKQYYLALEHYRQAAESEFLDDQLCFKIADVLLELEDLGSVLSYVSYAFEWDKSNYDDCLKRLTVSDARIAFDCFVSFVRGDGTMMRRWLNKMIRDVDKQSLLEMLYNIVFEFAPSKIDFLSSMITAGDELLDVIDERENYNVAKAYLTIKMEYFRLKKMLIESQGVFSNPCFEQFKKIDLNLVKACKEQFPFKWLQDCLEILNSVASPSDSMLGLKQRLIKICLMHPELLKSDNAAVKSDLKIQLRRLRLAPKKEVMSSIADVKNDARQTATSVQGRFFGIDCKQPQSSREGNLEVISPGSLLCNLNF